MSTSNYFVPIAAPGAPLIPATVRPYCLKDCPEYSPKRHYLFQTDEVVPIKITLAKLRNDVLMNDLFLDFLRAYENSDIQVSKTLETKIKMKCFDHFIGQIQYLMNYREKLIFHSIDKRCHLTDRLEVYKVRSSNDEPLQSLSQYLLRLRLSRAKQIRNSFDLSDYFDQKLKKMSSLISQNRNLQDAIRKMKAQHFSQHQQMGVFVPELFVPEPYVDNLFQYRINNGDDFVAEWEGHLDLWLNHADFHYYKSEIETWIERGGLEFLP